VRRVVRSASSARDPEQSALIESCERLAAPLYGTCNADALYGYFHANSPVMPAGGGRIFRIN
jgi:hypothetical protein